MVKCNGLSAIFKIRTANQLKSLTLCNSFSNHVVCETYGRVGKV